MSNFFDQFDTVDTPKRPAIKQNFFDQFDETEQEKEEAVLQQEKKEADLSRDQLPKLTQSDLLEDDRFLDTIKDYMEEREGIDLSLIHI